MIRENIAEFHTQLFFWLYNTGDNHPIYQYVVYILAEKIDLYVLLLGFMVFGYFIYQSSVHQSWKRFIFLFKELIRIFLAVGFSWAISFLLKIGFAFPRPFLKYPDLVSPLFPHGGFDSFPSGHATLFMALGVMMSLHHRRIGYIFIILAVLISIARVISGVHFPIDIIIGWMIGGCISYIVYKKFLSK